MVCSIWARLIVVVVSSAVARSIMTCLRFFLTGPDVPFNLLEMMYDILSNTKALREL